MSKGKAPSPPNPNKVAAAQTATNIGTALAEGAINRVNQVGPDGSLTYSQTGTTKWRDPLSGRVYDIPSMTATTTLSQGQQKIKDQSDAAELNLATLANNQSAFLNDYMGKPVDLSSQNIENYINTHFMDDFDKRWNDDKSSLETQLANKGIRLGSGAYTRAMADYSTNKSNARDNLYGNQYGLAQQAILTERNQPLNEIAALLSGSQVNQPNFVNTPQSSVANTDYASLAQQGYQNELGQWQQKQQSLNQALGGMFGMAGNFIKYSDRRLKTDIKKVGRTDDGQNIYSYRYKGGRAMHLGLMAQEVAKRKPEAVIAAPGGYKAVDYNKALEDA
ncbi:MAG: tail fiber domain-containing protein [Parvibaculaceae bacterium]